MKTYWQMCITKNVRCKEDREKLRGILSDATERSSAAVLRLTSIQGSSVAVKNPQGPIYGVSCNSSISCFAFNGALTVSGTSGPGVKS